MYRMQCKSLKIMLLCLLGGAETGETSPDAAKDKKKKNRCHTCKKKVGLTGKC